MAPTLAAGGKLRLGLVHDPTAERMGGVAGHAGLFSTAADLAIFARMLLDGGRSGKSGILTARSIAEMTAPQYPQGATHPRGLGWDIAAPLASTGNSCCRSANTVTPDLPELCSGSARTPEPT